MMLEPAGEEDEADLLRHDDDDDDANQSGWMAMACVIFDITFQFSSELT